MSWYERSKTKLFYHQSGIGDSRGIQKMTERPSLYNFSVHFKAIRLSLTNSKVGSDILCGTAGGLLKETKWR